MNRYEQAKEMFAKYGVDTEKALDTLAGIPVSVHCWQGDDVVGFDGAGAASGGIQTTGNYPGRARTPEELMADIELAFSLMAGKKRVNLHASYAFLGKDKGKVDRDAYRSLGGIRQENRLGRHRLQPDLLLAPDGQRRFDAFPPR